MATKTIPIRRDIDTRACQRPECRTVDPELQRVREFYERQDARLRTLGLGNYPESAERHSRPEFNW